MEALSKLEAKIIRLIKDVPHLPLGVRRWFGENVWWLVAISAVMLAIAVLVFIASLFSYLGMLSTPIVSYYASTTFVGLMIASTAVGLVFAFVQFILMAFAIAPLKARQKRGWVLLFASWLVAIVSVVVGAVLTLNPLSFIGNLIFGALVVAVTGYILFEMHGQFAHVEKSAGVKGKKA